MGISDWVGIGLLTVAVAGWIRAHLRSRDSEVTFRAGVLGKLDALHGSHTEMNGRLLKIERRISENGFLTEDDLDKRFINEWEKAELMYGREIKRHDREIVSIRHWTRNAFDAIRGALLNRLKIEVAPPREEDGL